MAANVVSTENTKIDLTKLDEFDNHENVVFVQNPESGLRGFISIHRSNGEHPSFGATRLWNYQNDEDALSDALRLSRLMSYKSALAGLDCGGAKGVILRDPEKDSGKGAVLSAYAEAVNELNGKFVTGTDVGLIQSDMVKLQKSSPYFVGIRVNPTIYTAFGLLSATQAALKVVFDTKKLSKRSFAIQGAGKIGTKFLDLIYSEAGEIYVTDIDMRRLRAIKNKYPRIKVVDVEEIHKTPVDIFSPCALSGAVNSKNIQEIQAKIIVGGANNQLENDELGEQLYKSNIVYIPDYVANAGGLISVVSEYYNKDIEPDTLMESISKIGDRVEQILDKSEAEKVATNAIADTLAKSIVDSYQSLR